MATHRAKPLCGTSLNYEVVGGTTAPTSFNKENTIWVNTDTTIGEHQFGYTEPNTDVKTGDIWIPTDIDNATVSFNAIKRNELMVYPLAPKMWDGSKWSNVTGAIYQNGEAVFSYEEIILSAYPSDQDAASTIKCSLTDTTRYVTVTENFT